MDWILIMVRQPRPGANVNFSLAKIRLLQISQSFAVTLLFRAQRHIVPEF
jgi:hypothetical protein